MYPRLIFLWARPTRLGVFMMLAIGLLATGWGSISLPFVSPSESEYGAAVVYTVAPVLTSVVALGMMQSQLSGWERLSVRSLTAERLLFALAASCLAVVALLPSGSRSGVMQPAMMTVQSVAACVALGAIVGTRCSFEWQIIATTGYGTLSVLVSPALDSPSDLLLVGAPSPERLAIASLAWSLSLAVHSWRRPNVMDGAAA